MANVISTAGYENAKVDLTTNNLTTLYSAPSRRSAIIESILVSEDSGNADTITVTLVNSAGSVFSLFKTKTVSANATVELLTKDLILIPGDILKVQAATANRLHVVASLFEIPKITTN